MEAPEHYLGVAMSNMGDGLFLVGKGDSVIYCNRRLLDMMQIKDSPLVGSNYSLIFKRLSAQSQEPPKTERDLHTALQRLTLTPTVVLISADSSVRWQIKLFPLCTDRNESLGWGAVIRDVSAEWSAIAGQTEQLSSLNRELRLPVAKIKGFVTALLDSHQYWEENERHRFLDNIYRSAEQMSRLLEHAQEMLRLQMGLVILQRRPTELKPALQQIIRTLAPRFSGFPLSVDIAGDLPTVEVDIRRIEQAMTYVLEGILRFIPQESHVQIVGRLAGKDIVISLICQATMLSEDMVGHLFEPFQSASADESERMVDVKLGLHIARELILAHGGRIEAQSTPGQGITLRLVLPTNLCPAVAGEAPQLLPSAKIKDVSNSKSKTRQRVTKALITEDDPQMMRLLKMILETDGYQVITAEHGEQALEMAVTRKPDVILLDMYLPDMNGLDVCAQLRKFSSVPIVMVTANSKSGDIARALDLGADDYVVKPFSQKELLARVRAGLRRNTYAEDPQGNSFFRTGDLSIDFEQRRVSVRGESIKLTPTEYKVLCYLAANAGRMLSHEQILSKVWGPECQRDTQYLWVSVSRLRKKLEVNPAKPEYILTEPGVGYYLPAETERTAA